MVLVGLVNVGVGLFLVGVAVGLWLEQRRGERWLAEDAEDWLTRHTPVL
jgi:hypothetical protein